MQEVFDAFALPGDAHSVTGSGLLPSRFAVTDLVTASIAAVGGAMARLMLSTGQALTAPAVSVDRRLASLWSYYALAPQGWTLPPTWDPIAGDYPTADGWIRLHTNLPHHRAGALRVLGCEGDRDAVAAAVRQWEGDPLETEIHAAGGVAAKMRSLADWAAHPNGAAVASEPLVDFPAPVPAPAPDWRPLPGRPLAGLRVLDLTRVLAGPVATRMLAGFGAEVLRIDPPGWEEGTVIPDVVLGKSMAVLDLKTEAGRDRLLELLGSAHVLVHGYRPGALDGLGLGAAVRRAARPGLIEVTLDAWGWTGPWAGRRGFDSLVQMSSGIAHAGMDWAGADKPTPLPVQALDHATGYLMAASALTLLTRAVEGQGAGTARLSLSRTGALLTRHRQGVPGYLGLTHEPDDHTPGEEATSWGPARRLRPALTVEGAPVAWSRPALAVGSAEAAWS